MERSSEERVIFERIADHLSSRTRRKPVDISWKTDLWRDLGMYGEDALDFLEWYNQQFSVDMKNLDFSKHFENEGHLSVVLREIFLSRKNYFPITIDILIDAAK